MHRIALAFRAFFGILFSAPTAQRAEQVFAELPAPAPEQAAPPAAPAPPAPRKKPQRSEALTLLATLQREARLVDFLQEPIAGYSDAQIGAAVRDVHRDAAKVLERLFALQPVEAAVEGAAIEVPAGFDPARIRLVGNVQGEPPVRGQLCHHGWEATRCELPEWTGGEQALRVVAPAEVELK